MKIKIRRLLKLESVEIIGLRKMLKSVSLRLETQEIPGAVLAATFENMEHRIELHLRAQGNQFRHIRYNPIISASTELLTRQVTFSSENYCLIIINLRPLP
jgi:hypothetical protein